jgi:hypothetical protein
MEVDIKEVKLIKNMEIIVFNWNKNLDEMPFGLNVVKLNVPQKVICSELAFVYQTDGIKGDFYAYLPNIGNISIPKSTILEWLKFELIDNLIKLKKLK